MKLTTDQINTIIASQAVGNPTSRALKELLALRAALNALWATRNALEEVRKAQSVTPLPARVEAEKLVKEVLGTDA